MESSAAATCLVLSTVSRQTQQRGTRYLYLEDTILLNLVCCPCLQSQLHIKAEGEEECTALGVITGASAYRGSPGLLLSKQQSVYA